MKIIKVTWIDAEFVKREFKMQVPIKTSEKDVDQLVMNTIFDMAVDHYSWSDK